MHSFFGLIVVAVEPEDFELQYRSCEQRVKGTPWQRRETPCD
jgi:hypothetical protein